VSKKPAASEFSHISINSPLTCDRNLVGKHVVVARNDIRAVKRVDKQLSAEFLQQCYNASSCMHAYCHRRANTGCRHSTFFFFRFLNDQMQSFSVSQYTSNVIVVHCCMNSAVTAHFLSQRTLVISCLAEENVCLNVSASLVNACASAVFTALDFQNSK
jgi:hypothetical protein